MTDPFERPHTRTQVLIIGGVECTASTVRSAATVTEQELTVSGAINATANIIELNHATVAVAATIADFSTHAGGLVVIADTSASGTAAHTVTLTVGTFDGTNNTATFNAPGEVLTVMVKADGSGHVVGNIGAVALSSV